MAEWHTYLSYDAPAGAALAEADPDKEGVVEGVKAQVCECLILFMERNEEEFAKFLQTFTQDVWQQLVKVSQAPGQVCVRVQGVWNGADGRDDWGWRGGGELQNCGKLPIRPSCVSLPPPSPPPRAAWRAGQPGDARHQLPHRRQPQRTLWRV